MSGRCGGALHRLFAVLCGKEYIPGWAYAFWQCATATADARSIRMHFFFVSKKHPCACRLTSSLLPLIPKLVRTAESCRLANNIGLAAAD